MLLGRPFIYRELPESLRLDSGSGFRWLSSSRIGNPEADGLTSGSQVFNKPLYQSGKVESLDFENLRD
jgi:hypothetical protein